MNIVPLQCSPCPFFAFPAGELLVLHLDRAWNAARASQIFWPNAREISCIGVTHSRSFRPGRSHNSWQPRRSKWTVLNESKSVSGEWVTILVSAVVAYLAWSSNFVSASSWFDLRPTISLWRPLVELTHLSPSWSPSPMISDLLSASSFCARLHTNFVKRSQRFTLLWRLEMYIPHCLGKRVNHCLCVPQELLMRLYLLALQM